MKEPGKPYVLARKETHRTPVFQVRTDKAYGGKFFLGGHHPPHHRTYTSGRVLIVESSR